MRTKAHQALFAARTIEMGVDGVFSTAICDSSDERFRKCLWDRPELVDRWIREYGRR